MIALMWALIVPSLVPSRWAISLLDWPVEIKASTSRCRGVSSGASVEPDCLRPEEHLGRGDGQSEGRVHHRERNLGEDADLAGDAQGRSRLVGEVAMTSTAKTCSIIHVGLWKRWRTRRVPAQGAEVPARP